MRKIERFPINVLTGTRIGTRSFSHIYIPLNQSVKQLVNNYIALPIYNLLHDSYMTISTCCKADYNFTAVALLCIVSKLLMLFSRNQKQIKHECS